MRICLLKKVKIFSFVLSWLSTHCYSDLSWSEHFLCLMWFQSINVLPCARSMDKNRCSIVFIWLVLYSYLRQIFPLHVSFFLLRFNSGWQWWCIRWYNRSRSNLYTDKEISGLYHLILMFFCLWHGRVKYLSVFCLPGAPFLPCLCHQCLPSFQWLMVNYYRLCQNTRKQPYCVIQMKVNFCTDFHAVCMMYM